MPHAMGPQIWLNYTMKSLKKSLKFILRLGEEPLYSVIADSSFHGQIIILCSYPSFCPNSSKRIIRSLVKLRQSIEAKTCFTVVSRNDRNYCTFPAHANGVNPETSYYCVI